MSGPKLNDLIGKKIFKVKVSKESKGRAYISRMDMEDDISLVFMPHQTEKGRIVTYFEIWGKDQKPKTWKQRLMNKAISALKVKIDKYEKKHCSFEEELLNESIEELGEAQTDVMDKVSDG